MKDKAKKINGKKITLIILVSFLAAILLAGGLFFGIASCTGKRGDVSDLKEGFTVRKATPTDGSLPTDHSGIDNIGYMAYVLDNQPYYHAYANNSTKSTGYEQVTQTWKDFKSAAVNGTANNVMVCSDLSYSALVKSATQTCFVGSEHAYMRSGNKPKKTSVPSEIVWSIDQPAYYTNETYLKKYGEFSTELSVYVINEDTLESCEDVVDNGDGTYSQKFYLSKDAACWYQYGMKTRGSLKSFPEFEKIEITFTFDSNWQVLSSYCEEKTKIAPSALGGVSMSSSSKTTTEFDYTSDGLDGEHFAYFDNYYKQYVGKDLTEAPAQTVEEPALLDVLGSAFSNVVDANGNGQQFALDLTLGQTQYTGKIYAKLGDMSDVLGSLDVRIALGRKDSGNQDLYIEFKNGSLNVYYSDAFAMLVDINRVASAVGGITEWIKSQSGAVEAQAVAYALSGEDDESSLDLDSLLAALDFSYTDNSATISIVTDDLLGFGIGLDLQMNFNRIKQDEGSEYSFKNMSLGGLTYNSALINLGLELVPDDDSEIISHNKADAPADIADFINGVYGLLNSDTIMVEIKLDGTSGLEYLNGVQVESTAQLKLENGFEAVSVFLPLTVKYNGLSVELEIYYTVNLNNGDYGEIYLNILSLNEQPYGMKIHCNIGETVDAVKNLIELINSTGKARVAALSDSEENSVAEIINAVINIDFASIIKQLTANGTKVSVLVDADEIFKALKFDLGIEFGDLLLELGLDGNNIATLSGSLSKLGLSIDINGSKETFTVPDKNGYIEATEFIEIVSATVTEAQKIIAEEDIEFTLDATLEIDGVVMNVNGSGEVIWKDGKIRVAVDLEMSIADTLKQDPNSETVYVKFVYDETEGDHPIIRLAINELGLEIYENDINEVSDLFATVIGFINNITGGGTATVAEAAETAQAVTNSSTINYTQLIGTAFNILSNITFELCESENSDAEIKDLLITYAQTGNILLGANGGLSLDLNTDVVKLNAFVKAGDCSKMDGINGELDNGEYTFDTADTFVKTVYDYVLDLLDNLSVKDLLGSSTYSVEFILNGSESGIKALDGINVTAYLYYTENNSKLAEADINLNIKGTQVVAKAYYTDRTIYISLDNVAGTALNDIAFKASLDNIYDAAATLVELISSDELAQILNLLLAGEAQTQAITLDEEGGNQTSFALTELINYILTLDINSVIVFDSIAIDETVHSTVTINVDGLLEALGVDLKIGTVFIEVNPETHSVYACVSNGESSWITLSAEAVEDCEHGSFDTDKFIDIDFVSTLLSDIKTTLEYVADDGEEEGNNGLVFSLKGDKISIDISVATITITDVTVTVGINEDKSVYFTLYGYLNNSTYTTARYISVTYADGYITFGRDVDNPSTAIYKIMTFSYLIDNMMDSDNSPVRWLLGTSKNLWGVIAYAVNNLFKLSLDSGLTNTEELYLYYLYNGSQDGDDSQPSQEDKVFNLSDLINGMSVKLGDDYASTYGNNASDALSKFGLSDSTDYYAFDLNLSKVISAISNLYAVLMHNPNGGISGLYAYASIAGTANITVELNGGLTKTHTENFFEYVVDKYDVDLDNFADQENKTFGCYNSEYNSYESSEINKPYQLTVYVFDENKEYGVYEPGEKVALSRTINSGSVIYLLEEELWLDDAHTVKMIYVDAEGNDLGLSFVIRCDMEIYQMKVGAKTVTFHNPYCDDVTAQLFVGATIPNPEITEIDGKTFAGWYLDEACTQPAFTILTANDYYAHYVDMVYTAENGVVYTFIKGSASASGYYSVTGFVAGTDGKDYSLSENTLMIAGNIQGYPVTEIALNAFNYKITKISLKKVIVPETVVTVGAQAFMDNKDMELAVFLAESVTFMGTTWDGNQDKGEYTRFAFYGCGTTTNEKVTKLQLYYNFAYSEKDNTDWFGFYREQKGLTSLSGYNYYYIGNEGHGGSRNGNRYNENSLKVTEGSAWSFVTFKLEGDVSEFTPAQLGLADYFIATSNDYDRADIENRVKEALDKITAEYGYIYAYDVSVSGEISLSDGAAVLTVTITENLQNAWYELTIETNYNGNFISYEIISDNREILIAETEHSITYYVQAGSQLKLSAVAAESGIYSFEGWLGINAENNTQVTVDMPAGVTDIKADWVAHINENIYVASDIDFIYNNETQSAGGDYLKKAVVNDYLAAPKAQGYTFLGWAVYDDVNGLTLAENTLIESETSATYYALWVASREDVTFALNGTTLTATANDGSDLPFYGWYNGKYSDFSEMLSQENSFTFTKQNTAARLRLQYTFTLSWNGSSNSGNNTITCEINGTSETGNSNNGIAYTKEIKVLEGSELRVEYSSYSSENGYQYCTVFYQNDVYKFSGIKPKTNFFGSNTTRYFKPFSIDSRHTGFGENALVGKDGDPTASISIESINSNILVQNVF